MALVMMATLFFVKERELMRTELPFITISDLVLNFSVAIPDRRSSNGGAMEILRARNRKREREHRLNYGSQPPSWGAFV